VFTGECHNQLPLLQKQSIKKESRVEQKAKINVFSDYSLVEITTIFLQGCKNLRERALMMSDFRGGGGVGW